MSLARSTRSGCNARNHADEETTNELSEFEFASERKKWAQEVRDDEPTGTTFGTRDYLSLAAGEACARAHSTRFRLSVLVLSWAVRLGFGRPSNDVNLQQWSVMSHAAFAHSAQSSHRRLKFSHTRIGQTFTRELNAGSTKSHLDRFYIIINASMFFQVLQKMILHRSSCLV